MSEETEHEDYEAIKRGEVLQGGEVENITLPATEGEKRLIEEGRFEPTDPEVEQVARGRLRTILQNIRERWETLNPRDTHREEGGRWNP